MIYPLTGQKLPTRLEILLRLVVVVDSVVVIKGHSLGLCMSWLISLRVCFFGQHTPPLWKKVTPDMCLMCRKPAI